MDPVELAADRPDEGREIGGMAARDRLEVEVHPVRAAIADGRGDLAGEGQAGLRAAEEGGLDRCLAARPGERRHGQDDPRVMAMGRLDDARQLRARPAAPARRRLALRVLLQEVPVAIRPDAEVGDRREEVVVEDGRPVAQRPVRQEAEDLAAEGRGGGRVGCVRRRRRDRDGGDGGDPRDGGAVDGRVAADPGALSSGVGRNRRPAGPPTPLGSGGHGAATGRAGRQCLRDATVDGPRILGRRLVADRHRATGTEPVRVAGVGGRVAVLDRRLDDGGGRIARRRKAGDGGRRIGDRDRARRRRAAERVDAEHPTGGRDRTSAVRRVDTGRVGRRRVDGSVREREVEAAVGRGVESGGWVAGHGRGRAGGDRIPVGRHGGVGHRGRTGCADRSEPERAVAARTGHRRDDGERGREQGDRAGGRQASAKPVRGACSDRAGGGGGQPLILGGGPGRRSRGAAPCRGCRRCPTLGA